MTSSLVATQIMDAVFASTNDVPMLDRVFRFFQDGGPFMFVNLVWLAVALAVAVERMFTLMVRFNLPAAPFMEQITKLVNANEVDRAKRLCAQSNTPLAKVFKAGLSRANSDEIEVAKAVEESLVEHSPQVTARVAWLWSLANIATLVGLVGTIFGLITTFQALGDLPADQKQKVLSDGISKAMNNTAFALSIAVICIMFHVILKSYSAHLVDTVELYALKLENLLSRRASGEGIEAEKAS